MHKKCTGQSVTAKTDLNSRLILIFAVIVILCFFISAVLTLPNYGVAWDEGLGNMFFGERYCYYLTSFNSKYLDFKTELSIKKTLPLKLFQSPFHDFPYEFPALADTLSAASMHFFAYRLSWLDPVDGFHLFTIVLSTAMLAIFYAFVRKRLGSLTAIFSLLFLATFPRLWSDMHFNVKDVPEMVFYCLTIISFLWWYKNRRVYKAILTGVLFGCTLAIKANAIFLPLILLLGIIPWSFPGKAWKSFFIHIKTSLLHYLGMSVSALLIYFLSWPYLYSEPSRIKGYWHYIISQGGRSSESIFNFQPLGMTFSTMPAVMLVFLIIGSVSIFLILRRSKNTLWKVILLWMWIPVIRVSLPGMQNFDGIRHFLKFLPAAAIIAGEGVSFSINALSRANKKMIPVLAAAVAILISINIGWITTKFHPYQYLYFNDISGGVSKAQQRYGASETTDYWAVSYRQGLRWLNEYAEQGSSLFVPIARWVVDIPADIWLRDDITIITDDNRGDVFYNNQPVYVMMITREEFYEEIAQYCHENLTPAYEISVEGHPIMQIYKIEPQE